MIWPRLGYEVTFAELQSLIGLLSDLWLVSLVSLTKIASQKMLSYNTLAPRQ